LAATFKGIYRSIDGGGSWASVLPADSGYTEIAITSTGVMYAATRNSNLIRIWRSTNGTVWTPIQPPGFPTVAARVVFGLAPSNPRVVYVFATSTNAPVFNGDMFWKYTYVSGDGSGAGGTWEDRTANKPTDFITQGGYDMMVSVKPDDENFVILGGTDLYRSTDAFQTTGSI